MDHFQIRFFFKFRQCRKIPVQSPSIKLVLFDPANKIFAPQYGRSYYSCKRVNVASVDLFYYIISVVPARLCGVRAKISENESCFEPGRSASLCVITVTRPAILFRRPDHSRSDRVQMDVA